MIHVKVFFVTLIFIFTLLCGASKGFMKAPPFKAPHRSVKIKFSAKIFSSSGMATGRVNLIVMSQISSSRKTGAFEKFKTTAEQHYKDLAINLMIYRLERIFYDTIFLI